MEPRNSVRLGLVAFAAAGLLAGRGGASASSESGPATNPPAASAPAASVAHGTLSGTLAIYGGLMTKHSCGCFRAAGRLRLTSRSGHVIYVPLGLDGHFNARLPVGAYHVVGAANRIRDRGRSRPVHWSMGSCRLLGSPPGPQHHGAMPYIRVGASAVTHIQVGCVGE